MAEPVGFTISVDGLINFEFFLPTEKGIRLAASDAGFSEEDYEIVPLVPEVR